MNDNPLKSPANTENENSADRQNISPRDFDTGSTPSGIKVDENTFQNFKEKVFKSRPNVAKMYEAINEETFYNYSKSHIRENRNKIIKARKDELAETVYEAVRKTLGSTIAESVVRQLKDNSSVSTVQHSSPLGHPDSLNTILQNALPYFDSNRPDLKNVIVMACSGISFNNTKFPRGHIFHSFEGEKLYTDDITLFGHTVDALPVIHHEPYGAEGIKECQNWLLAYERDGKISKETKQKMNSFVNEIYNTPHPLSADDYLEQLTITNYWIFKKLFQKYNKFRPNLVYLSQEKITLGLIKNNHLNKDTVINKILFDPKYHALLDKYFDGITGAFNKEIDSGTFLFWGHPVGGYKIQLKLEGNKLVGENNFSVELTPEGIKKAIENKQLIPSIMLVFIVLAFYYGLFLGGGNEQVNNLTLMKDAWVKMLQEVNDQENIEAVENLITTNYVIPRPLLAFAEGPDDLRIPVTALDLIIYGDQGANLGKLINSTKNVTVGELLERAFPSFYREYAVNDSEYEELSKLYERDVEKFRGLDAKIPPLFTFS
ncbi:MAG: hypothetical protein KBD51_02725 [Candidatus Levybacteria bacterium]|nr:hypothetical protein [Candidatus Levybacteria bacterium]